MYYAEQNINGVLCYRTHPRGAWKEFSKEQLTERVEHLSELLELRKENDNK